MKSEFKLMERVRIVGVPTTSDIHGKTGFIAGKSSIAPEFDCYIVWLDIPTDTHMAVSISENCIEEDLPIIGGVSDSSVGYV